MSGDEYSPPVYCNEVKKLIPFENQEAAEEWLKESGLDINGTPLLVPFKNKIGRIEFLKPGDPDDNFRIMGAANYVKPQHWFAKPFNWLEKQFKRDFAPHVNNLKGNTIQIAKHGFIVVYERGEKSAGRAFAQLFRKEKEDLKNQIKITQTNDGPQLNPAKFIQNLSQVALDLEIRSGMNYFIIEDEEGKQTVYRHTFKEGVANPKIALYLAAEEERCQSEPVRVHNNKTVDHHISSFLKDLFKWSLCAVGFSLIGGGILTIFTSSVIAGPVAFFTFVILGFLAICKASNDNKSTIKFGEPEFVSFKPHHSFLKQLKADLMMAWSYLFRSKIVDKLLPAFEQNDNKLPHLLHSPFPVVRASLPSKPQTIEGVLASVESEKTNTVSIESGSTAGCFPFNFLFFRKNLPVVEDKDHSNVNSESFVFQNGVSVR